MVPLSRSSHALVTGGGRGIGRAIALALSQAGATVTVIGRSAAPLEAAVAEGAAHHFALADVTDEGSLGSAIAQAASRQPIDILVANAGAAESAPFHRSDTALFRRMIDVNLMGVVHAMQAVARSMAQRKQGRIVAIASTAGLKGYPYVSAYCAAKHAVVGLSKGLRAELAGTEVGVSVVCPGMVRTPILEGMRAHLERTGTGQSAEVRFMFDALESGLAAGMPADVAAGMVVRAVKDNQFWVLPNGGAHLPSVRADFDEMLASADDGERGP